MGRKNSYDISRRQKHLNDNSNKVDKVNDDQPVKTSSSKYISKIHVSYSFFHVFLVLK